MKIIHTSDLHLGHQLYGYDRGEEQAAMLLQIVRLIQEEQPDALLICGDVYHTPQPSSAVQRMFAEALVEMHDACPTMTIIVTAGNHDSGTRHEIFRSPWLALKVHSIGNIDKENIESHIIEIKGKGYVAAVPYAYERNIPDGFFQTLLDKVAEKNRDNLPVMLTAHTTVGGCDFTGHDHTSELSVGGIDAFGIEEFGQGYDYLALGHIHRAQFVGGGQKRIRYCGTPLPVSFDECYPHSVSVMEIHQHGETPDLRTVEIENPHPLVTLPSQGTATWEECLQLLTDYPDDIPAYIRLNVVCDTTLPPYANSEAQIITEEKACRFCHIHTTRTKELGERRGGLTVQEFQAEDPIAIAQRYADDICAPFDEEMRQMFRTALKEVEEEERNQ